LEQNEQFCSTNMGQKEPFGVQRLNVRLNKYTMAVKSQNLGLDLYKLQTTTEVRLDRTHAHHLRSGTPDGGGQKKSHPASNRGSLP